MLPAFRHARSRSAAVVFWTRRCGGLVWEVRNAAFAVVLNSTNNGHLAISPGRPTPQSGVGRPERIVLWKALFFLPGVPSIAKFITAWIRRCAAENFFSILKTVIYRTKLKTYEEARLLIGEYIHFYNHERIKLKISCKKE